jgi:hypothetical protein
MRTLSVTQGFEFISYSLGSITFFGMLFSSCQVFFCLRSTRIEKTYFALFCLPRCFFDGLMYYS